MEGADPLVSCDGVDCPAMGPCTYVPGRGSGPGRAEAARSGTFHRAEDCGGRATFLVSVQLLFLKKQIFMK